MDDLMDAAGDAALVVALRVEHLDLADERVIGIQLSDDVGETGSGLRLREGHVEALVEQEAAEMVVVGLLALARVGRVALVQPVPVEPFAPSDIALEVV